MAALESKPELSGPSFIGSRSAVMRQISANQLGLRELPYGPAAHCCITAGQMAASDYLSGSPDTVCA